LDLSGNNFATLPNLKKLSQLFCLNIHHCKRLKYLPELPSQIAYPSQILHLPGATVVYLWETGIYISNCPELVEREGCTSIGYSWMIQNVKAQYEHLDDPVMEDSLIQSVTPGSEIPRWFNNQHVSMAGLIIIDSSPVMHDKNWIGVACCAVIAVSGKTVLAMDLSKLISFRFHMPVNFFRDPEVVSDKSDHTWLFFLRRKRFIRRSFQCGTAYLHSLQKEYNRTSNRPDFHVEVKKYGYRWLYKHDLELPNGNLLTRKRKILEIEQNEGRNQGKRSEGRISAKRRKDAAKASPENTIKMYLHITPASVTEELEQAEEKCSSHRLGQSEKSLKLEGHHSKSCWEAKDKTISPRVNDWYITHTWCSQHTKLLSWQCFRYLLMCSMKSRRRLLRKYGHSEGT
ncbi:hypothetical protein CR513_04407, partial [Mucuna pruriens]